jgi:hypothetical protein
LSLLDSSFLKSILVSVVLKLLLILVHYLVLPLSHLIVYLLVPLVQIVLSVLLEPLLLIMIIISLIKISPLPQVAFTRIALLEMLGILVLVLAGSGLDESDDVGESFLVQAVVALRRHLVLDVLVLDWGCLNDRIWVSLI